jgi:DNA-binding CsgD family transcriptional regulator
MLLGRDHEVGAVVSLVAGVRKGNSGALVLRGEPGIGKTELLDHAVGAADGMQLTRVVGVQSETELGFGALHQLLRPFLERMRALPPPQRHALGIAFGLEAGTAPDRFLVGLAALSLIADAAVRAPVLCVVDDAQWLDRASAEALGFVARRVLADRIGMLFAVRSSDEPPGLAGLPLLEVSGLPASAAAELLASAAPFPVADGVRQRIVAETFGNPLALIELARDLSAEELAGSSPLPDPLPLRGLLERLYQARVKTLPADAQAFLLLAAAEPAGDHGLLWRAAGRLGLPVPLPAAMVNAVDGLVSVAPRIRFRHPLIRNAAYWAGSPDERRRVHEALAAASDPELEPERRAWHLAAAATAPDESVAAALELAATSAGERGDWPNAAALLERASGLTPTSDGRARRTVAAARARIRAGDAEAARVLLLQAGPGIRAPRALGEVRRIEGRIFFAQRNYADACFAHLAAARLLGELDPPSARAAMLDAFAAARVAGKFAPVGARHEDVLRLTQAEPRPERLTLADQLLDGYAVLIESGPEVGPPRLREVINAVLADGAQAGASPHLLPNAWTAAAELFDDSSWRDLTALWIRQAREQGPLALLPLALSQAPLFDVFVGRFARAERGFAEWRSVAAAFSSGTEPEPSLAPEVVLLAWQGNEPAVRATVAELIPMLERTGRGLSLRVAQLGVTVLELGLGNYQAALASAQAAQPGGGLVGAAAWPDLIEAAVHSGEHDVAVDAANELARLARSSGSRWALGLLARSRALVSSDSDAEPLYEAAIDHLEECLVVPQLARAHLVYGEWLRRQRRRRDARAQLRLAYEAFDSLGATAFAERARGELLATGDSVRKRQPELRDALTPQEDAIARLAAEGATNQEIASRLFISNATVAYHLKKVFRKLDVSKRAGLSSALGKRDADS